MLALAGGTCLLLVGCANQRRTTPAGSSAPATAPPPRPTATAPYTEADRQRQIAECVASCERVQQKHPEDSPVPCEDECEQMFPPAP